MKTDILIIGSGCAGLYCALHLPREKKITIVTKADLQSSDSFLAQGGMCVLKEEADFDSFMEDTLRAGHYENDRNSVEIMIRSSQEVCKDLVSYGVEFCRDENGEFLYTKEGAHSQNRILFHEDITGREITEKLLAEVQKLPNVTIYEHTAMIDLLVRENVCCGAVVRGTSVEAISADITVLATGGIGGLYEHSTNFKHLTADALAMAVKYRIALRDVDYIQIHPTTFYTEGETERSFLISESVRGEGAKLRDKKGERFVDELLPRDMLTQAILEQMKKDGTQYVWEDLRDIPKEELKTHFPNIVTYCKEHGYDVRKECIPVVPAQHYFMGGIKVNDVSKTTMERLYAIGETACNGVHGKNRLASNSLLESLVFAKRAAKDIASGFALENTKQKWHNEEEWTSFLKEHMAYYNDEKAMKAEYRELVMKEIEKAKEKRL